MKIKDLIELENEMIQQLRKQALGGDSRAAALLLEHLRAVSKNIDDWKRNKEAAEATAQG